MLELKKVFTVIWIKNRISGESGIKKCSRDGACISMGVGEK